MNYTTLDYTSSSSYSNNKLSYEEPNSNQKQLIGLTIANNEGVPGTITCLAYSFQDGRQVLLTNYHVLFGNDGKVNEKVWLLENYHGEVQKLHYIGNSLHGRIGTIHFQNKPYFIDCALVRTRGILHNFKYSRSVPYIQTTASPELGTKVLKWGGGSGLTEGIITNVQYADNVMINGKRMPTLNQILIRPLHPYHSFSTAGDSGAAIINEENKLIGLLWGITNRGEGIACPILPVMHELKITLEAVQL